METTRASLLAKIRNPENTRAWSEFNGTYRPILERFARRGLDVAEAEEIAQECMLVISQEAPDFEYDPARGRFRSWLYTLVSHRVLALLQNQNRRVATMDADLESVAALDALPEEVFERIWMQEHLRHCLDRLSGEVEPATLAAFRMYVLEEADADTVCASLDMNRNQLYTIKWRLTQRIADMMQQHLALD